MIQFFHFEGRECFSGGVKSTCWILHHSFSCFTMISFSCVDKLLNDGRIAEKLQLDEHKNLPPY